MSDAQVALLQRRVLAWDYWQLYQSYGKEGRGLETLQRPPTTFSSAEVQQAAAATHEAYLNAI